MSVQKLITEAEKLLDKKKTGEAIERLRSALSLDPLNQLVTSRLANIYLEQNDRANAAKAYADLAGRLGTEGKSAIAIAFYKQAIEIHPENVELKLAYARECEEMGKVGDAQTQAQAALQHYLRRKKYLDAAGVMPILLRLNGRDDLRAAWIEVIQLSQGEQKLIHLLVALCGPPGLVSTEFNVGGDASALSDGIYGNLKGLLQWFPRDPRLPYALAWAAQRRGRKKDFYEFVRECLRREPDFCLGYLLLARTFAEEGRLGEALFVFKILKDRLAADRSVDMGTLTRLIESFVSKNPWLTMGESGGAKELEPAEFLQIFQGGAAPAITPPPVAAPETAGAGEVSFAIEMGTNTSAAVAPPKPKAPEVKPAPPPPPAAGAEPVIVVTPLTPPPVMIVAAAPEPVLTPAVSPPPMPAAPPAAPAVLESAPARDDSVEFTNIIKVSPEFRTESASGEGGEADALLAESGEAPAESADPSSLLMAAEAEAESFVAAEEPAPSPKAGFNPLEAMVDQESVTRALELREEKTEMFSPMDILGAKDSARARYEVKASVASPAAAPPAPPEATAAPDPYASLVAEGEATKVFSPMEAVSAAGESRRPPAPSFVNPPAAIAPEASGLAGMANLAESGDATQVIARPSMGAPAELAPAPIEPAPIEPASIEPAPVAAAPEPVFSAADNEGATQVMSAEELLPADLFNKIDSPADSIAAAIAEMGELAAPRPAVVFQAIPDLKPAPAKPAAPPVDLFAAPVAAAPILPSEPAEEVADLGDDLLQEPTRVLVAPPKLSSAAPETTRHLLQEIRKEVRENKSEAPDADAMLRRAERYIVKQNFYLARKALRLARELGAEEERVKSRLRDIRKIELPTGQYFSASDDESRRERSSDILDRLEAEFGIQEGGEEEAGSLSESVSAQLERIFRENDPRTILDFGVGLHEMGLFRQAEDVFTRITTEFPEFAFDAYYLAAVAKFARRDYAGAASILKHLSAEVGRSEEEKIQIYYTLGELFERMQRPESSLEFFKKVAQLDANYRNVRHKLEGQG